MKIWGEVEHYLEAVKKKSGSEVAEEQRFWLNMWLDYLKNLPGGRVAGLEDLREEHFRHFLAYWFIRHTRGKVRASAGKMMAVLEKFCRWVYAHHGIELPRLYAPVREALEEALPRLYRLEQVLSPFRGDPYTCYVAALEGKEKAREMGLLANAPYLARVQGNFEVVAVLLDCRAGLKRLRDGRDVGPVQLPREAEGLLEKGDILHLELGQKDFEWEVLESGFCYPALAREFLQQEEL